MAQNYFFLMQKVNFLNIGTINKVIVRRTGHMNYYYIVLVLASTFTRLVLV